MKKLILLSTTAVLLSSCGIYTKYKPAESVPDNLYGETFIAEDTTSLGNTDWHELFTDPLLQAYIEQGLQNNTDYLSAQLRIEEAEATLLSSKLAFLPSFALAPQGTVSSFDGGKATQTYSLPVTAGTVFIFGKAASVPRHANCAQKPLFNKETKGLFSAVVSRYCNKDKELNTVPDADKEPDTKPFFMGIIASGSSLL